jgi:hypothetical protein
VGGCVALAVCDAAIHRRQQPAVVSGSRSKKKRACEMEKTPSVRRAAKKLKRTTRKCKRGKKKKWDSISKREKKYLKLTLSQFLTLT